MEYRPEEAKTPAAWASVLFKAVWYSAEMGRHNVTKEMNKRALEARKEVPGPEHRDTLRSISNLA